MIDIRNFINKDIGHKEVHEIKGDGLDLYEGVVLEGFAGDVELTNLEDEILAIFKVSLTLKMECDRCLEEIKEKKDLKFAREYTFSDEEDKIEIGKDQTIEILEPIREEAILSLPLKKLCKEDCEGIN